MARKPADVGDAAPDASVGGAARARRAPRRLSGLTIATLGAFAAPILLAVLLSMILSSPVVPEFLEEAKASDQVPAMIADVSKLMITFSSGLAVGSLALFNGLRKRKPGRLAIALVILALATAFVSIYAGLRFLFDMARQLSFVAFDFEPLRGRIYWQGAAMLVQVSALCALVAQANAPLLIGSARKREPEERP